MKSKALIDYWHEAIEYLLPGSKSDGLFQDIVFRYNEKSRSYHNLNHITQMLEKIDDLKLNAEDETILVIATFMHDVIYLPGKTDNEYKSAEYSAQNLQQLGVKQPIIEKISQLIIDTKDHQSDDELSRIFLDIDMSILGAPWESYHEYYKNVKKEFNNIPGILYNIGRRKFLKKTLENNHIFYTKHFADLYEAQARENMKKELQSLGLFG